MKPLSRAEILRRLYRAWSTRGPGKHVLLVIDSVARQDQVLSTQLEDELGRQLPGALIETIRPSRLREAFYFHERAVVGCITLGHPPSLVVSLAKQWHVPVLPWRPLRRAKAQGDARTYYGAPPLVMLKWFALLLGWEILGGDRQMRASKKVWAEKGFTPARVALLLKDAFPWASAYGVTAKGLHHMVRLMFFDNGSPSTQHPRYAGSQLRPYAKAAEQLWRRYRRQGGPVSELAIRLACGEPLSPEKHG